MHTKAFSGRVWSRVIAVHKRCDNTFNFKWELCLNCCQVPQRLISQICRHDGSVSKQANTVLLQTSSRLRAFVPKECQIDIRQQWWLFNGVFTTVILQIHFTNLTNSDWTDSSSNQLSFLVAPFPDGCDWQTIRHVRSSDLFFPHAVMMSSSQTVKANSRTGHFHTEWRQSTCSLLCLRWLCPNLKLT